VTVPQAWLVMSLPPVECYLPEDLGGWHVFRHLATNVREHVLEDGLQVGDTVWGTVVDGQQLAVAWDWVEARPGVMCLLDPNSIVTNIRFLDRSDTYQEPLQAIISANRLTHHWPWQSAVADVLKQQTAARPAVSARPRPTFKRQKAAVAGRSEFRQAA
jgi:hypothetical protein